MFEPLRFHCIYVVVYQCIKHLHEFQYEASVLISTVQTFSPIIYDVTEFYNIELNFNYSNLDESFTMVDSNSFLSPYEIPPTSDENTFRDIFGKCTYHVCCMPSFESHHWDDYNGYTQHTITLYKIVKPSLNYNVSHLPPDLAL